MSDAPTTKNYPKWLPAALDFVPLLIFFAGYKLFGVLAGTAIFMIVIIITMTISKLVVGRLSPMNLLSAVLILVFGGLTLYTGNIAFIQMKPTIIYLILSLMLFGGVILNKPTLKYVLEHGYDGLTEKGWRLLSRNWAWFFLAMAIANYIVVQIYPARSDTDPNFGTWLGIKIWGFTVASMLFAAANVPMLMKHGLGDEGETLGN
jgi:intracellular septation protein